MTARENEQWVLVTMIAVLIVGIAFIVLDARIRGAEPPVRRRVRFRYKVGRIGN